MSSATPHLATSRPYLAMGGISGLVSEYRSGRRDAAADLQATFDRIAAAGGRPVWITVESRDEALEKLGAAAARLRAGEELPLFGIPFAVKDNIDVAGLPTTAACPDFAYRPDRSAAVVERLVRAGAIPVGKTNLDQFATGLNGTRSPYGASACAFDPARVSGGSSSGSAVAVSTGLVPFSLGTDTAGSGRVPAAFNNIVGLKPTRGLLSTRGVVPACRSLDCVSVLATNVPDALLVTRMAAGFDADDPFSRRIPAEALASGEWTRPFRFGVLGGEALEGADAGIEALYRAAVARLEGLGGRPVPVDFAPFRAASELLYGGPWVAERLAAIQAFALERPGSFHPAVRQILEAAGHRSAVEAYEGGYRLAELVRAAEAQWAGMDLMLMPTAPSHPTIAAMLADPIGLNAALGRFTQFLNLMDLAAVAVPAGFGPDRLPFGVQLVGPALSDGRLALLADRFHRAWPNATIGAGRHPVRATEPLRPEPDGARVAIAVVGAHLEGQPLNGQLIERGGRLREGARTAPGYSLYALPGTVPAKPGLLRDGGRGGIEVEVWDLPVEGFGSFVAAVPPPLAIGTIELADGANVKGFLCEPHAAAGAPDITSFGGWRAYLASATARAA